MSGKIVGTFLDDRATIIFITNHFSTCKYAHSQQKKKEKKS